MYRYVQGECLYFSDPGTEAMTWYDAKQYCRSRGGNLVYDKSQTYHDSLVFMMSGYSSDNTWVGLTKYFWYWPTGE